ncbi:uncharacterized protein LOC114078361 [Solanum pennellii]|uniref:Uncharacterized protein LOC114078361 n=1 Tax=Solanum pennellii TaxID=28526 RepID=A0ABM1VGJ0_SOLPN|nr:uncharacterized protein LOC114078361 [Solanum pennellii]
MCPDVDCPLLEDLVLKDIDNPYFMSINAPNLRELVLEDEDDFVNIFSSIPALECFSWDLFEVDNGSTKVIPTRLPSVLNCLKCLFMSGITLGEFFELSFALCIIRSSPNLEEIEIKIVTNECILSDGDYFECVPQEVVDEIPAWFSDITFNHLRTVNFYDVLLEEVEMQLIKVLLAKSPSLVKMVIKPRQMETNKSLNVLAEITKFQRQSSKAEVVCTLLVMMRTILHMCPGRMLMRFMQASQIFNHLRTVKLSNVAGAGAEMQLIKVLLAKSPALVKMELA